MFKSIDDTWNVFKGCRFGCSYCNAEKAAKTRLRHIPRYKDGFTPKLIESELYRNFRPGKFIFVAYMGDIAWATLNQFEMILSRIRQFPQTDFLICTKNPHCFWPSEFNFPPNVILGATIETNRRHLINAHSRAPSPVTRFRYLAGYPHSRKFLSIEPIMDFDLEEMTHWIELLQPNIIEIGADNYHNSLPEPPWSKVEALLQNARQLCPRVIEKDGLGRLKGGR